MDILSISDKVLNACHRLNAEAYEMQVIARGKPLTQFIPCAKAEELMSVIRKGMHFGTANIKAHQTICGCHNYLTFQDLLNYEMDDTYKKANYNHDLKTLYPKLYSVSNA
jgi:hypothetical protein